MWVSARLPDAATTDFAALAALVLVPVAAATTSYVAVGGLAELEPCSYDWLETPISN